MRIVLVFMLLLMGAFIALVYITRVGDLILFGIPLFLLCGVLSVGYIGMVVIHTILQLKRKLAPNKNHVITAAFILMIGLFPGFGPIGLLYGVTIQPRVESISKDIKDSQFKGPTDAQITQANIEGFDKAQALFDGCNVSRIYYWRFDRDGPQTEQNNYIVVASRNNGTIAYGPKPPDVHLLTSDKENLKNAIKDYHKGPYPACAKVIPWNDEGRF